MTDSPITKSAEIRAVALKIVQRNKIRRETREEQESANLKQAMVILEGIRDKFDEMYIASLAALASSRELDELYRRLQNVLRDAPDVRDFDSPIHQLAQDIYEAIGKHMQPLEDSWFTVYLSEIAEKRSPEVDAGLHEIGV